ncbi:MFS general substrate transporter [Dacryopinax primogenitus]|uniref:MFS general substrate transporter n=1 Tax=Dacryopinax primogenitus (strain DJM 731) TaxID=1858805 RepID=M5G989_DACPD|nr:MFS general substrate transporter [Dacryopinax primogenitus]EJU02432.1 MFS general substrate transporter [Dacryopinax primogenitus]
MSDDAFEKEGSQTAADSRDDSHPTAVKYDAGVDVAVLLMEAHEGDSEQELSKSTASKIRTKLDWRLLPLLFLLYTVNAMDKSTLGSAAALGILTDAKLSSDELNNLGSAFYIGYLIAEYPQVYAMQRLPVAKWIAFNIFLWAVFIGLQAACTNYGGLFALRFLLGMSEACITSGLMLVTSMFYTRVEIGERIGWSFQCNGFAMIIIGFIAYGMGQVPPSHRPAPWQWLMIIMTIASVIVAALFWWGFPDNPTTARFLTEQEKVDAVRRVKGNQAGIETKVWKRSQFMEAMRDYKTWIFFFMIAFADLQNGISVQYSLIIGGFGFSTVQTTILNVPSGFTQIIGVTCACLMLRFFPNSRSIIALIWWIPSIVGAICLLSIPLENKNGLLVAYYIFQLGGAPSFVMMLSWVTVLVSGHTKKLATNAVFLVGYALGQILCTQFWKSQYRPRDTVPWAIILASEFVTISLIILLRVLLIRENKRRDALQTEKAEDEFGYVEQVEDGQVVRRKVEKRLLDLTDWENTSFRYPL